MSHRINNKKALLCSRAFLQKPYPSSEGQHPAWIAQANLLRYFPKYIDRLAVEAKDGATHSKVKRVKICHVFQDDYSFIWGKKNLNRTLFKMKEKQIQAFAGLWSIGQYSKHLVEEIRTFTGLRTLKLISDPTQTPYFLKKIIKYIEGLRKLEHLELALDSDAKIEAISRLDSYERTLESLKTLKIESKWEKEDPEEMINLLLKALLKNKNILKSTTNLNLGCFNSRDLLELLEEILSYCPKLATLSLNIDKLKPEENSSSIDYVPRFFQAFRSLNNLQAVKIVCKDVPTHLRDFALPPSIQHVDLSLIPFDPSKLKDKTSTSGDLPEIATTFCDRWSQLINLKTLKIQIGQYSDNKGIFTSQFIQCWLKNISNLQNLIIDLSADVPNQSPFGLFSFKGDFDMSAFFESIQHLKDTLESLTLLDTRQIYYLKNLPQQPLEFPHLHKLAIKGFMPSQGFEVQRLFENNLRDLLIKESSEKPFNLILSGVNFDSVNSFLNFIQSFDQKRNDQQRPVEIDLTAYLNNQSSYLKDEFSNYFTLEADGLRIQANVFNSVEYKPNTEPATLLKDTLKTLKISEAFCG